MVNEYERPQGLELPADYYRDLQREESNSELLITDSEEVKRRWNESDSQEQYQDTKFYQNQLPG